MIDIHSHILPMVDDGASSIEMALELLDEAYRDGTDAIILTPHYAYAYDFINPYRKIKDYFDDFKMIVEDSGIPIKIYLGSEYLYTDKKTFEDNIEYITTLNNTRYLLIEFFFDVEEDVILEAIDVIKAYKLIPVIAHPERFEILQQSYDTILRIVNKGALLQLNKGSILGRYGYKVKECATYLLENHLITFVGSDAHHPLRRSSLMYEAYDMIKHLYGKKYAKKIFVENPKKLLNIKD